MVTGDFSSLAKANRANSTYHEAEEEWRKGHLKRAFRLMLASAEAGVVPAFATVANFYDHGIGIKSEAVSALYWYRRAYRSGDHSVANNIGCILRDRERVRQALAWFRRAARLNDGDANLNIAKIYLYKKRDLAKAIRYLSQTRRSKWATEGSKEEAKAILVQLSKQKRRGGGVRVHS